MSVGVLPTTIAAQPTGALQLLYENTVSAVASVDIVTRNVPRQSGAIFQSDYDDYIIDLIGILPATNGANLQLRVSIDGGATYISAAASYSWDHWIWRTGASGTDGSTSATEMFVAKGVSNTAARGGTSGFVKLLGPALASSDKIFIGKMNSFASGSSTPLGVEFQGRYLSTNTINAIQAKYDAGNLSGTFRVYGVAKSSTAGVGPNILTGKVVQEVYTQTGAVATGTTLIPFDDTIPQNTEGDQYMTLAITPTNASNRLRIDVVVQYSLSVSGLGTAALFQDTTANALAAGWGAFDSATAPVFLSFTHHMTAGTTSSTTFKVRVGGNNPGTLTFNGQGGGRILGGVLASSITITEIVP